MRETYVTIRGNVADQPRVIETPNGTVLTKFRLATAPSTLREGQWERGHTSYYEVTCFKKLGENVAGSLAQGDGVIVHGRLEVREWTKDDRSFKDVQVTADGVGHDLTFGVTTLLRPSKTAAPAPVEEFSKEESTEAA